MCTLDLFAAVVRGALWYCIIALSRYNLLLNSYRHRCSRCWCYWCCRRRRRRRCCCVCELKYLICPAEVCTVHIILVLFENVTLYHVKSNSYVSFYSQRSVRTTRCMYLFWSPIRILYHQNWLYFNFDRKAAPTMRSSSINSKKHMKSTQAYTHTLNDDDNDDELTHNALVRSLDCATQFVHLRCWFVCWLRSSVSVSRSVALPYKNNSFFRSECDNSPTLTESEQQPSIQQ